ncbi:hypothetical protein XBFM1_810047 [Xenorhabdus bovienii str. feltiae Moldova]|uniref:Uncharacterized protein n=1 Tax=Xenorhabdus bovienii str. feltiae Moldova TaxID=1398200 RepID=A0A077NY93_XENBV|nr:hypothetical protein XBFM1_810047 [Xenorhabdus bovienii str. feltiae Moldova]
MDCHPDKITNKVNEQKNRETLGKDLNITR